MARYVVDPLLPGRLRELRQAAGLSYRRLGRLARSNRTSVWAVETGQRMCTPELAAQLDKALKSSGELARMVYQDERQPVKRRTLVAAGGHLGAFGVGVSAAFTLPNALRAQLITGVEPDDDRTCPLSDLVHRVALAHDAYQQARYGQAAAAVADILALVAVHVSCDDDTRDRAHQVVIMANVLISKLAAKVGDAGLAWIAADRACTAAQIVGDPALRAAGTYQVACALGQLPGRLGDAQHAIAAGLSRLGKQHGSPRIWSVRGALELHGAVVAAKLGDVALAQRHLSAAAQLADELRADANHLWTAFGPTNVRLHEVAVQVALHRPDEAIRRGEAIDTSRLPPRLVGRRAQVQVDLACAWAQTGRDDRQATLYLLEAERLGAEVVRFNHAARDAVATLLARDRRPRTPGLVALAQRAGVAA